MKLRANCPVPMTPIFMSEPLRLVIELRLADAATTPTVGTRHTRGSRQRLNERLPEPRPRDSRYYCSSS